ncbi:MAG: relaxase/mobilization nuclease domain-containing protein, partial [Bacteroidaceae bacterium]|nr:relaxase/mobilization nuclease domain-containing protein [Bacteroidaceae bacterium]
DYVENGAKTEDGKYISSYACEPETVDKEFLLAKQEYLRKTGRQQRSDVIAYQIRQSFMPGEITPEEANQIGYDLAMSFTKGKHAFIVATHTDRAHIHNHIIFNSTNLDCDRKFRNFFLSSFVIQRISDGLCLEHGLSVIKPKDYKDRENKDYRRVSIRSRILEDIDAALEKKPNNFEELLNLLEQEGYEVKRAKRTALKGKGQKRFIRFDSLEEGYKEADLRAMFESGEKQPRRKTPARDFDLLINIQEKLAQGKTGGYERWAKVYNIKQLSKALLFLEEHDVRDYETLAKRAADASARFNELSDQIRAAEKRLAEIAELKKHIITYSKTRGVYVAYRKSGYSKKFLEAHREEITLHKAAKEAFSKLDGKIPKVKDLNEEYQMLLSQKRAGYKEYYQAKKKRNDYMIAKQNIDSIMQTDLEQEKKRREAMRGQLR